MKTRDLLELILLAGIWGASFLFMRIAGKDFPPMPLIELRVIIAGIFLSLFVSWSNCGGLIRRKPWQVLFLGAFNSAIPFSLFAFATQVLGAGYSAVLNATVPLFGALLGFLLLNEKLTGIRILGLCLGFAGVILLVLGKISGGESHTIRGNMLAVAAGLTAALLYGIAAFFTKKHFQKEDPMATASTSMLAASLCLLPGALLTLPKAIPATSSWLAAVALAILCTGVPYAIYFRLLQRVQASQVMVVTYLIPVFGVLWGVLFLGEPVLQSMILGGVVILTGVWLLVKK